MLSVMSAPPSDLPDAFGFKQFIRPTSFVVHSVAARLVSRGEDFASSVEFSDVIFGGVAAELVDALLEALSYRIDGLGSKDMCALIDLYTAVPSMQREADETAGLPASSHALAGSAKDSLSSFYNDLSLDRTPMGED